MGLLVGLFNIGMALLLVWTGGSWVWYAIALIVLIALFCFWGHVTETIMYNKGYYYDTTKWFWAGFFFGMFAMAVALSEPDLNVPKLATEIDSVRNKTRDYLQISGWKCTCGKTNSVHVTTCKCGVRRDDVVDREAVEKMLNGVYETEFAPKSDKENSDGSRKSGDVLLDAIRTPKTFKTVKPGKKWQCTCGKIHPSYVTSCSCGKTIDDAAKLIDETEDTDSEKTEKKSDDNKEGK